MEAVTEVTEDMVAMGEDIGARTNIENNKGQDLANVFLLVFASLNQ